MGLLLAAALAAHIQTGGDLLRVCQSDTATCDAFIRQTALSDPAGACIDVNDRSSLRKTVIEFVGTSPDLKRGSARQAIYFIYGCDAD